MLGSIVRKILAKPEDRREPDAPQAQRPTDETPVATADGPLRRRRRRGGRGRSKSHAQQAVPRSPDRRRTTPVPAPSITGPQPRTERFGAIAVSPPLAQALRDIGYAQPTPIQDIVIEPMLSGVDIVGQAQTGTGKTAGFGIPIAEVVDDREPHVQAVVLVPTRELAQQVSSELGRIAKHRALRIATVFGGAPIKRQIEQLAGGAQIVVGTPGRIIDHLERGTLRLDKVRIAVLDEADQMLDIGFFPDIRRILRATPRSRQTALFTATVPTQIRRLIYSYLREPEWYQVGEESRPVEEVEQVYYEVAGRDKPEALDEVLREHPGEQTLVFCRTQGDVDRAVRIVRRKGHSVEGIHGGMRQSERNAVMERFRRGEAKLLVSTNLTSRGIDVPTVENVVNYDIPESVEEYIHRIGRTARMGRPGTAITFLGEWDIDLFEAIRNHVGKERLERRQLALYGAA